MGGILVLSMVVFQIALLCQFPSLRIIPPLLTGGIPPPCTWGGKHLRFIEHLVKLWN
jgi:hypothetical protein